MTAVDTSDQSIDASGRYRFRDRQSAGLELAQVLRGRCDHDALVLGLPRGGILVAQAVAGRLGLQSDVYVVRKLRAPLNQEFALGAIAEDGPAYIDDAIVGSLRVSDDYLQKEEAVQLGEIQRQVRSYRGGRGLPSVKGRQVILVDDGIATGATTRAAANGIKRHEPANVLVAAPVASSAAVALLSTLTDGVVCVVEPRDFWAVGQYYENFDQVTDEQIAASDPLGWQL